jgi:F-type H+-transporting ATPase subunit delta
MIVADRYASSLMQLAKEKGKIEEVVKDMRLIIQAEKDSHELGVFLKSPVVKKDKKIAVLESIFKGKVSDMSMQFVKLIASKHRESILADIAKAFDAQYKRDKNIFTAVVTSAYGLDDNTRKKMLELVRSQMHGEVELIEKIDKETIGGFVLKIGDRQIDKTVARQLSNLKKELTNKN